MENLARVGAASWGFRELALEERLVICKRLGVKYLEAGIANAPTDIPLEADGMELEKVKRLYLKYGISSALASTGNDFTLSDQKELKMQVEKVKKVIDICAEINAGYLRIFAGFSPAEEITGKRWDNMISSITEVAEYARRKKVILAIETHGGVISYPDGVVHFSSVTTAKECLKRMLSEIPEDVKFVFDPANLYAVELAQPEEIYQILKGRIAYFHMKDFIKKQNGHYVPAACGESDFDWKALMRIISDSSEPVLVEYENCWDVEAGMARSLQYLENIG